MDPNANLTAQLELARALLDDPDGFGLADARDLAEGVIALDKWLRRGGFPPAAWTDRDPTVGRGSATLGDLLRPGVLVADLDDDGFALLVAIVGEQETMRGVAPGAEPEQLAEAERTRRARHARHVGDVARLDALLNNLQDNMREGIPVPADLLDEAVSLVNAIYNGTAPALAPPCLGAGLPRSDAARLDEARAIDAAASGDDHPIEDGTQRCRGCGGPFPYSPEADYCPACTAENAGQFDPATETRLDQLASFARTALDDPAGVGLPARPHADEETRRAHVYACACMDAIIETLNPTIETNAAHAETLLVLGWHAAETQASMKSNAESADDPEERAALLEAHAALETALDAIDYAIASLTPEEPEPADEGTAPPSSTTTTSPERTVRTRELPVTGLYAVLVPPDTSDEPVRWLFLDESDADAFAAACGPDAWVSFEPIAETLDDEHLAETSPEETRAARRMVRGE